MESSRSSAEEPVFGQVDGSGNVTSANEVVKTRFAVSGIPGQSTGNGWENSNIGEYVSKLSNASGNRVGPNVLLKVMAGDVINATTQYYFKNAVTNTAGNTSLPQDILNSLILALSNGGAATSSVKYGSGGISNTLGIDPDFLGETEPDAQNVNGTKPKAYLTVLFFDERFNYVATGSTYKRTNGNRQDDNLSLSITGLQVPKNGYAYVYISNESDEPVYFDNFNVGLNRGRIIEEDHYYAYGLKIAGISSAKLSDANEGETKNNYLFQSSFSEFNEDIGWNQFDLRDYDPQIGRFVQADPFGQFLSPYTGMANDPINTVDPSGGIGIPCPGTSQLAIFFMKAGEVIGNGLSALSHLSPWLSIGVNAARVGTDVYNNSVQFKAINNQLVGNMTQQVGYNVYQRSFAPWQRFGNAFHPTQFKRVEYHGDGRGFSTSSNVTSRITLKYSIDLNLQNYQGDPSAYSDESIMYKEGTNEVLGRKTGTPSYSKWSPQKTGNTTTFKTSFEGNNPLFPGSDPIVWTGTLALTKGAGYIDVDYSFMGKGFPAFESFIEDGNGTRVFIGVYDAPAKGNAIPVLTGSELSYSSQLFRLRIYTNSNGSFSGNVTRTYGNGQSYTMPINTWNNYVQQLPAAQDLK